METHVKTGDDSPGEETSRLIESGEVAESLVADSPKRRSLAVATAISAGLFVGLGLFTFQYGGGTSYLSNAPKSCANCHVMQDHFEAWLHSSHHRVATCNDCHLPHDFLGKWFTKVDNGLLHSVAFTTGIYPDPIQIKPRNRRVTQAACIHCHGDFVHALLPARPGGEVMLCIHCHDRVGHAQK